MTTFIAPFKLWSTLCRLNAQIPSLPKASSSLKDKISTTLQLAQPLQTTWEMLTVYRNRHCLKRKQLQDMDIEFEKEMNHSKKTRKQVVEENNNKVKEGRAEFQKILDKARKNKKFKSKESVNDDEYMFNCYNLYFLEGKICCSNRHVFEFLILRLDDGHTSSFCSLFLFWTLLFPSLISLWKVKYSCVCFYPWGKSVKTTVE